jgi:alkylhydroperoxidase family enzyme
MFSNKVWLASLLVVSSVMASYAADGPASTRPEMKKRIEALKGRTARLSLPPLTEQEIASGRPLVNNGRLRSLYLPPSWQSFLIAGWGGSSARRPATSPPPNTASLLKSLEATPGYGFKTRLFWVVSRANDCQYCLGHQELKLKRIGMTDDQLAALDCHWDRFPENEQAALKITRKLTLSPHLVNEQDIAELRPHFSDAEIIDVVYTVSRYNAVNRWTASTGIPQDKSFGGEDHGTLDTPTSAEFSQLPSAVIPVDLPPRPEWEPRAEVETKLKAAQTRETLVKLPAIEDARKSLILVCPGVNPPAWFQAISNLSVAQDAWAQRQAMTRDGKTPADLRILIAWVTARENRAWYSMGHARARHVASGGNESLLYSFADLEKSVTPANAEVLRFARKLTSAPQTIVDADVSRLKGTFDDFEVAEIIQLICDANAFDRFTEALRLPLEK